jgi:hypothetical protein
MTTDPRRVTCRVLTRRGDRCTGEAVIPDAELQICTRHLAEAMRLLNQVNQQARVANSARQ